MRTSSQLPVSIRASMPVVCPPERQGTSTALCAVGMACRLLILWCAVFGLAWFVCDAFLLTATHDGGTIRIGVLALMAAAAVLLFAAMTCSTPCCLIGLGVLAAGVGGMWLLHPPAFWRNTFVTALNACLERLFAVGYGGPSTSLLDLPEQADLLGLSFDRATSLYLAAGVLTFLLAAVFVPCLLNRTRLALPAAVSIVILVVVFTYNISRSNWSLLFILSSFAAILVLAAYDRRYFGRHRDCDNAARIFPPDPTSPAVPPMPAHLAKKARKKPERLRPEEELAYYVGDTPAKPRALTAEQRAERRRETRAYRAALRAGKRWRKKQLRARVAAGGFAGAAMLLIAMLMLVIPAAYTKNSFTTVEMIDEPMKLLRRYVTAYLMGDNPILDEMGYGGNVSNFGPHSTEAERLVFSGEEIFTVETMHNTNLYLRGWLATDYRDGNWYSADAREEGAFSAYRDIFGTAFSPEVLRTNFYQYVDPSVSTYTDYTKRYQNHIDRGFVTMQVNLRRVGGSTNLVYLPTYYNPKVGIVDYVSSEPSKYTYVNYFDGIYTGRRFLPGAEYAAVAYVTTMRDDTFMEKVSVEIAAYHLANAMLQTWFAYTDGVDLSLGDSFTLTADRYPVSFDVFCRETGLWCRLRSDDPLFADVQGARTLELANEIVLRYLNFTAAEHEDLAYARRVETYYREFVYDTYTAPSGSNVIWRATAEAVGEDWWKANAAALAAQEAIDPAVYTARHDAVMRVMRYLAQKTDSGEVDENGDPIMVPTFTYTLEPTKPVDESLDSVENFLAVTKEGYCVQFASAAVLMLREMGIPARYVEGYIVTDFHRNLAAESTQRYTATVRDYHAHAWVEVYYDGIGWLNYEATPNYMDGMYASDDGRAISSDPLPWQSRDEEEEEDVELDLEELARLAAEAEAEEARRRRMMLAGTALTLLLVVTAVAVVLALIVRRARRADARRAALYAAVRDGLLPGSDKAHAAARRLIDETNSLLAACAAAPRLGEQRDAYAARLSEQYAALCPIPLDALFAAIAAEEFGGASDGMSAEALDALAAFRRALGDAAKKQLTLFRRLYFRYVKHLL